MGMKELQYYVLEQIFSVKKLNRRALIKFYFISKYNFQNKIDNIEEFQIKL